MSSSSSKQGNSLNYYYLAPFIIIIVSGLFIVLLFTNELLSFTTINSSKSLLVNYYLNSWSSNSNSYYFKPCNCIKHIGHRRLQQLNNNGKNDIESTCSEEATWFGPNQKVISYSLFYNPKPIMQNDQFELYTTNVLKRLEEVKLFYTGWKMRIYSNLNITNDILSSNDSTAGAAAEVAMNFDACTFACDDVGFWCDVRNTPAGNFEPVAARVWRFLPIGDPTVDIFLSRDLDSFINIREVQANIDFEKYTKPFHVTRDILNNRWPISAGRFGVRNDLLSSKDAIALREEFVKEAWNISDSKSIIVDQLLLQLLIFLQRGDQLLAHDAYHCKKYNGTLPFPYQRPNRRVCTAVINPKYFAPKCPIECRPSYGKNWTYC